jgi:ABC-type phosphate transport system substrate-binding protein
VKFSLDGGGSNNGAKRVCGNSEVGSDVDIGNMSREWESTEAKHLDGFLYDCIIGKNMSVIQVPVAYDGLTVAASLNGAASECIRILGGLSTDQLRWMFSIYNEDELKNTGWNASSIANSDGNSSTRLWNEIDYRCRIEEILIAGPWEEVSFAPDRTPNFALHLSEWHTIRIRRIGPIRSCGW